MPPRPKAVVLLSGGLDSATSLAVALHEGFDAHALTFHYGQRHKIELDAARRVAGHFGVMEHVIVPIDLRRFGGSALTTDLPVPKGRSPEEIGTGIPVTYVPARNTLFLSYALAWAEVLGSFDIFVGVNVLDRSGYPDCRPEYLEAFERLANLATKAGVEGTRRLTIRTPLASLTKAEIIRTGLSLGVDYAMTSTCYDPSPGDEACGLCDACLLRLQGFEENGMRDPVAYQGGAGVSA